jgi:hypothetical protein
VAKNGEIYITEGLEDDFALNEIYGNLEVNVVRR